MKFHAFHRHFWIVPLLAALLLWQPAGIANADSGPRSDTFTEPPSPLLQCAASITVINGNDSGAGSLRQAIADLCAGGTITFAGDTTIALGSDLSIDKSLTIDGSGHAVTLSGDTNGDGAGEVGLFYVDSGANVTLRNLLLTKGESGEGGGVYNFGTLAVENCTFEDNNANYGGGIKNYGALTVTNSNFSNNSGTVGAAIYNGSGSGGLTVTNSTFSGNVASSSGVIYNDDTASITNSTFANNSATSSGIVLNYDTLTVTGSTFYNNSATSSGIVRNDSTAQITNSTFFGNTSTASGIIINNSATTITNSTFDQNSMPADQGTLVNASGTLTLRNSILSNAITGDHCTGSNYVTNGGGNLLSGSGDAGRCNCISSGSANLGTFGNHGGATFTIPLLPGSAALGIVSANCPPTDQRGIARPQGAQCDSGAYEARLVTIRANNQTINYGSPDPVFTYTKTPSGAALVTPPTCGVSGAHSLPGTYAITCSGAAVDASYDGIAYASGTLTVNHLTPVITWNDPADINQGTALSGTQLNASASVPGSLAYTPGAGTVLGLGPHTLTAVFTPNDAILYRTVSKSVTIIVNQNAPVTPLSVNTSTGFYATQVAAGTSHTCALTTSGGVQCWGDNTYGQLGDGTTTDSLVPVNVTGLTSGVSWITAGANHTCALTNSGVLKCWGDNQYGQLGVDQPTLSASSTPLDVANLSSAPTAATAGANHTCALVDTGDLACWGLNDSGQLGDGTTTNQYAPTAVTGLDDLVMAVDAGSQHTCANTSGGVYCWGSNADGQLGVGSSTPASSSTPLEVTGLPAAASAISLGGYHTCAITTEGAGYCWGRNTDGQLGNGSTIGSLAPAAVTLESADLPLGSIDAGLAHTCAVTASEELLCWGRNADGQLGSGSTTGSSLPVSVVGFDSGAYTVSAGSAHTCAINTGGELSCFGNNASGQLGNNSTSMSLAPVNVQAGTGSVISISTGANHTCSLTAAGGVTCLGDDTFGQLGNDSAFSSSLVPVDVTGLSGAVSQISSGRNHTCALIPSSPGSETGGVMCWGRGTEGQLGNGAYANSGVPVAVSGLSSGVKAVAAGGNHTCALIASGVYCWGMNDQGQLGNGSTGNRAVPGLVTGLGSGVASVSAGYRHTCVVLNYNPDSGGGIACWGDNQYGQLGNNSTTDSLTPSHVPGLTQGMLAVSAGGDHTCALTSGGGVKCWGYNGDGQLGNGTTTNSLVPVNVRGLDTPVAQITAAGTGALAPAHNHTCALTTSGGVKCWGDNAYGQIGDNTSIERLTPVDVLGLTGGVTEISTSYQHACALTGGGMSCWGDNTYGQLGDGTSGGIKREPEVSGGWTPSVFPILSLNANPSTYGDAITFSARLAGAQPAPGGTVQFMINGANFGSPVSMTDGVYTSESISTLEAGAYLIRATYVGDGSSQPSYSAGALQAVELVFTSTSVTTLPNPSIYGDSVTLSAEVTSDRGTPGGYVTFLDGLDLIDGCVDLRLTAGEASCATSALSAGTHYIFAIYTGNRNYLPSVGLAEHIVNQATPVITWADPAAITYGTALGGTQLNATANTAGTFVYDPAAGTVLNAGANQALGVTFTPSSANYTTATATVHIDVNQATPVITWADPAAITYGTLLSGIQLNASSPVSGSFTYNPPAGTLLNAGLNQALTATFTSSNPNYTNATATVHIDVNPAAPVITWSDPADIVYGTLLSGTQLNATANVPGALVYNPLAGTRLNAGEDQPLQVTFTPTSTNYTSATATVYIDVLKASSTVTWNKPADITYGTLLSETQLNATADVSGSLAYNPPAGTLLDAGDNQPLAFYFTSSDPNYTDCSGAQFINVKPANPVITWADPAAITYGTPLDGTQLNATANVPGTFTYNPAAGTVLNAGLNQALGVTFTPSNANYTTATATVHIDVNPAAPTITWADPAAITYGTALSGTQLNASTSAPGTFTYDPPAGTVLNAGPDQELRATFTSTSANYTNATATVHIDVNPAAPTITWADPAAITYGTALGDAQLNASSSTPGTFTYDPPAGTVLNAGTNQELRAQFTSSNPNYANASVTAHITVNPAAPTITWMDPVDILYGTALDGTQLNATANVEGAFTYNPPAGTILDVGSHQALQAQFTSSDSNYTNATATVYINVLPGSVVITWADPADIVYGTTLDGTQLNATANVPGTFTYTPPAGTILNAGDAQPLQARFTPEDTANYTEATRTVYINVRKADPIITWATPAAITYGTALSSTQLNATANVSGAFTYDPPAGTMLNAGDHQALNATFTSGNANYNNASVTVYIDVLKADPVITWATPAEITYGTALDGTQLNATANVLGTFTYNPPTGTVLNAGNHQALTAAFTSGNANYNNASATVYIDVKQAAPVITWSDPADITYGTALDGTQLNATANVEGAFTYDPPAGTVLDAGDAQPLQVLFAPTSANYHAATATVYINVLPAGVVITWSNPLDITYGTALSGTQLNATANVPGTFTYTPPAGTILNAGDAQPLQARFTPEDTANYTEATRTVYINVRKANPVITWSDPAAITYGTALGSAQLNATANIAGSFAYTPAAGTVLNAGNHQALTASFTSGNVNYNNASATVYINVLKADPVITWSTPADITYGTALGAAQLNATANVAGSFAYTPAAGVLLNAGEHQALTAAFTSGNANYNNASATVYINVRKATPVITWSSPAAITYGTALGSAQLNAAANVSGAFAYTPAAGSLLGAGNSQVLQAQFTPTDTANYNAASAQVNITVSPAVLTIRAGNASAVYGTAPAYSYTASGFVNSENASVLTGAPQYSASSLGAGTHAIIVSQGSLHADNYAFQFVSGTLTITKKPLVITADSFSMVYGSQPYFDFYASGFAYNENESVLSGKPEYTVDSVEVGSHTIQISLGTLASRNYSFTFVNGALSVTPATLTITATSLTKGYGANIPMPQLTYTISGFVNDETAAVLNGQPALSTDATLYSPAGTYTIEIRVGSLSAHNYVFNFVDGTLTVVGGRIYLPLLATGG